MTSIKGLKKQAIKWTRGEQIESLLETGDTLLTTYSNTQITFTVSESMQAKVCGGASIGIRQSCLIAAHFSKPAGQTSYPAIYGIIYVNGVQAKTLTQLNVSKTSIQAVLTFNVYANVGDVVTVTFKSNLENVCTFVGFRATSIPTWLVYKNSRVLFIHKLKVYSSDTVFSDAIGRAISITGSGSIIATRRSTSITGTFNTSNQGNELLVSLSASTLMTIRGGSAVYPDDTTYGGIIWLSDLDDYATSTTLDAASTLLIKQVLFPNFITIEYVEL